MAIKPMTDCMRYASTMKGWIIRFPENQFFKSLYMVACVGTRVSDEGSEPLYTLINMKTGNRKFRPSSARVLLHKLKALEAVRVPRDIHADAIAAALSTSRCTEITYPEELNS